MRSGLVVALVLALAAVAVAQPAGSGSGSGSAATGSGSGSGTGPRIIQLPTDANAPQVSAAASPTVVRLGGKLTLFVTATFGEGVEVNLREPLEFGPAFEVTRKLSEDKPSGDGRKTREWQIEVIVWELGDLVMPPVAVTYTAFGKADQVQTNTVKLRVEGVLGEVIDDPKAMRDHAPPNELISRDWFWLWVGIAAGGGLVVLIVVWTFLSNRRRRRTILVGGAIAAPRRFDSASEKALERLLVLEKSGMLERDDDRKQGFTTMVDIIREYIGSRYRVISSDQTSSELLRRWRPIAPAEEYELVEGWLEGCDIVKYGGLKATAGEAKQTLDDARALVVTTTQLQQAATAKPPPSPTPPPPEPPPPEPEHQEAA